MTNTTTSLQIYYNYRYIQAVAGAASSFVVLHDYEYKQFNVKMTKLSSKLHKTRLVYRQLDGPSDVCLE